MMPKLCSFITLVLALSAVNAAPQMGSGMQVDNRDVNVQLSYYDVGLSTCGGTHYDADFVVGLNAQEYGTAQISSHCFQNVQITVGGTSMTAMIVDKCVTCPPGGLALSKGLFEYFASLNEGTLKGDWSYV